MSRFGYIAYDDLATSKSGAVRAAMQEVETLLLQHLPESRPRSLALTKLEEAFMWIGKAIRDDQLERESAA